MTRIVCILLFLVLPSIPCGYESPYVKAQEPGAFAGTWLANMEIPSADIAPLDGRTAHSTVDEAYGETSAYIYECNEEGRIIVTHTFSEGDRTLRNYTLLFDRDKRCALWVAFVMNGEAYPKRGGRTDGWCFDPAIPREWQPDLRKGYKPDAYGNKYDRGHQTASGDHLTSIEQNKQTFYYSNMTPQLAALNRGVWKSCEEKVQTVGYADAGYDSLYVVTGPYFSDETICVKDNSGCDCPVPAGYFKCILQCRFSEGHIVSADGCAYLFDNIPGAERRIDTIDNAEELAGFDFFASVPKDLQDKAESETHSFF